MQEAAGGQAGSTSRRETRSSFPDGSARVEIRPLEDAGSALALGIAAGLEYTEGDTEGVVARWGAFDDGRLVGTVALRCWRGMAIVGWMAVDERRRGTGIGRRLLEVLEAEAVARGATRLWTTARAPGFYWANGFEPTGACEEADLLLEPCLECDQYGDSCHPVAAFKPVRAAGTGMASDAHDGMPVV